MCHNSQAMGVQWRKKEDEEHYNNLLLSNNFKFVLIEIFFFIEQNGVARKDFLLPLFEYEEKWVMTTLKNF